MKVSLLEKSQNDSLEPALFESPSIDLNLFNRNYLPELATFWHYEYSIFGCLDFNSVTARSPKFDNLRMLLFRQLIDKISRQTPIHSRNIEYFVTDEWSAALEKHLHFVVRRHPRIESNLDAVLHCFQDVWENQIHAGRCVVAAYIPELRGIDYICKRQYSSERHELQKHPHWNKAFHERILRDKQEGKIPELNFVFNSRN